jgi:hypothetical protein
LQAVLLIDNIAPGSIRVPDERSWTSLRGQNAAKKESAAIHGLLGVRPARRPIRAVLTAWLAMWD